MIGRIVEQLGRRRCYLITVGSIWVLTGFAVLLAQPPEVPISGLPHTYLPTWIRFVAWVGTGVGALVAALWPDEETSKAESIGFALLYIMPAERFLSYLIAWTSATDFIPGVGLERGWIYSLQYLGYVIVIYVAAGWSEPRRERL